MHLSRLIDKDYRYFLFIDGVPLMSQSIGKDGSLSLTRGFEIGYTSDSQPFVYNSIEFLVSLVRFPMGFHVSKFHVSGAVNSFSDDCSAISNVPLESETNITYRFSVRFEFVNRTETQRANLGRASGLASLCCTVLALSGFMVVLYHAIWRNRRWSERDPEDLEDPGWKLIRGDVNRPPPDCISLCARIGWGVQFAGAVLSVLFLANRKPDLIGSLSNIIDWIIIALIIFAVPAGAVSGALFKSITQDNSQHFLFTISAPVSLAVIAFFTVRRCLYGSLVFPFYVLFGVCCLNCILTLIGGWLGLHFCRGRNGNEINQIPHQIPESTSWMTANASTILAGLFLYLSLAANMHVLMIAGWTGEICIETAASLCTNFMSFFMIALFIGTVIAFLKLLSEDFRWWWPAYRSGASIGVIFFIYTLWFGVALHLNDPLSILIFLCISAAIALILSILGGAFSFLGAFGLVQLLYQTLKFE
jgi:hypothetical protein